MEAGSLQNELGCPGDWHPECGDTALELDAEDQVWQATFGLPAGMWEYKAALNGGWDENYGQNAVRGGANIPLNLAEAAAVRAASTTAPTSRSRCRRAAARWCSPMWPRRTC